MIFLLCFTFLITILIVYHLQYASVFDVTIIIIIIIIILLSPSLVKHFVTLFKKVLYK